jgi:hypothetical protein
VRTFVLAYLAVGLGVGFALLTWAALSSVRRHGFRRAARSAARQFLREDLPLYPKTPWAAWLGLIAFPVIAIWATVVGGFDAAAAIALLLMWLGSLALLRWHFKAKARWERRHGVNAPTPWDD